MVATEPKPKWLENTLRMIPRQDVKLDNKRDEIARPK